ncbi:MAG: nucleotidyltransferase domain-containing protein [Halomonas sp.]|uniref:nucleotidyltransferase domain-containing protein n=1 Tax=Halomonas sp. TaxID=1486246 RepID=UPI002ACE637E|nr:nucleotidyltransferase domain-containing protein [Halomonas sp.]MDZ7852545.1 nucleotidyltransferase domain-containing protein [Halomonas sp.]
MRLSERQREQIRQIVGEEAGSEAIVKLFGSRLDDHAKGSDVDLMGEIDSAVQHPAELAARLSSRISRALHGRKVDVLISAANLSHLPIHDIAREQGIAL